MNNDGKSAIRGGAGFAGHLRALARLLFGSPYGPPLNRKDFINEALIVFCVRLPILCLLVWPSASLEELTRESRILSLLLLLLYILPTVLIFSAPYFFVMCRRLKGLACPHPGLVTWAALLFFTICHALIFVFFDAEEVFPNVLSTALFIAAYLPLALISDRRRAAIWGVFSCRR